MSTPTLCIPETLLEKTHPSPPAPYIRYVPPTAHHTKVKRSGNPS